MLRNKRLISVIIALLLMLSSCNSSEANKSNESNVLAVYPEPKLPSESLSCVFEQENKPEAAYYVVGEMKVKINSIKVFDNIFSAGLKYDDLIQYGGASCELTNGCNMNLIYPNYFDGNTGDLLDNCYLVMIETEISNVSAKSNMFGESVFKIDDILELVDTSAGLSGGYINTEIAYCEGGGYTCPYAYYQDYFTMGIGETKNFKIAYSVLDCSDSPLARMAFRYRKSSYGRSRNPQSEDDETIIYKFNASKMIENLQ